MLFKAYFLVTGSNFVFIFFFFLSFMTCSLVILLQKLSIFSVYSLVKKDINNRYKDFLSLPINPCEVSLSF